MSLHNDAMELIRLRMAEIPMSQMEMSKRIGWTPKHVNRVLNGHAEPSMASLDFMAFIVGIRFTIAAVVVT